MKNLWRWLIQNAPLGLAVLAIVVAITVAVVESGEETTRTIILRAEGTETAVEIDGKEYVPVDPAYLAETLDEIRDVKDQADSASDSASTILSFIEGGSILLLALASISVLVFGGSIQDVRRQLGESISTAESRFQTNEHRIEELMAHIQAQVRASIEEGQSRVHESEVRMKELTGRVEESIQETDETIKNLHSIVNEAVEGAKQDASNSFRVLSLLLLAEQQVRARNRKTAISTLMEAHHIDPNNQTTNYLLGYLYVGRKEFQTAIDHLQRALQIDPHFAPALAAMGLAQRRMGDAMRDKSQEMARRKLWAEAELNLAKALDSDSSLIDADNESYFGTLGGLYRRQGRNEEAMRAYEDAVKITPNSSYPVGNLATLYKKLGHEEEAQNMYKRSIEIAEAILDDQPGDTWARLDMAQALLITGQKRKALDQYKNVIGRITEASPLEIALNGLEFLVDAPHPIDGVDEVTKMLQDAIAHLQDNPDKFSE
jgi:tetratricopeptide (TPR) repeat protein